VSGLIESLRRALGDARVQPLELALADWTLRHGGSEPVALALALTARAVAEGHSCLVPPAEGPAVPGEAPLCSADELTHALAESALSASALAGPPGSSAPLIVDGGCLYLQRYWAYEDRLAGRLGRLLAASPAAVDTSRLGPDGGLFDYGWVGPDEPNWQAVAAAVALRHRFAVVSGGPGTGKTYTVLRLIRLLLESAQATGAPPPVIRLAAPTGKAAARMMESIRAGLAALPDAGRLSPHLPDKAATLHRLLGLRFGSTLPRHDRDNPLAADVVIVDEASMIDLPLMAKLADAVPDHGRLVLLGDRYQLASVESGSVLAELCGAAGVNAFSAAQREALAPLVPAASAPATAETGAPLALADHVVTLQTSHRFKPESAIGRLAAAVNAGDADAALAVGREGDSAVDLVLDDAPDLDALAATLADAYGPLFDADSPEAAIDALDRVRLLTATRVGPAGALAMNQRIFDHVARRRGLDPQQTWYPGRPVIVLHNDYRAGLFNGDTGVCLAGGDGHLRVWFSSETGPLSLLPSAMPAHETAFAMTVHKSQGSEFEHVWLLLPEADSAVLSRELVYTGITRARSQVAVLGPQAVLRQAVARGNRRASGLGARLTARDTRAASR
jgi:exodeoxyribonuclease V alpha subunit